MYYSNENDTVIESPTDDKIIQSKIITSADDNNFVLPNVSKDRVVKHLLLLFKKIKNKENQIQIPLYFVSIKI